MKNNFLVAIFLSIAFLVTACGGSGGGTAAATGGTTGGTTTTVPPSPGGLSAVAASTQVTLSWSPVSGATSYNLYWSITPGVTKTNGSKITGVSSPYTQSSLVNGTTYYYVVTAVNSAGESVASSQAYATPTAPYSPPPPTMYTISGDVVGLAGGQSIVLQDNGGDNLTVSANGAFTFATPLAYNATYNVTVLTQPANGQTCAVATNYTYGSNSGSGTVAYSNVDTVRVSCYSVSTFAGSGLSGQGDAIGEEAVFNAPSGAAIDASGNLYVTDAKSNTVRKITPAGVVTTLAGATPPGYVDATGAQARFDFFSNAKGMAGIAVDSAGNVYVADTGNNAVRKITPAGVVTTLAGSGAAGYADGTGAAAQFNFKTGDSSFGYTGEAGIAVDGSGNVYVGDSGNDVIRKITPAGVVTTLAGSPGVVGNVNSSPGVAAQFYWPQGVAVDGSGNVYVADYGNSAIRKITSAGVVTTFAGNAPVNDSYGYLDATGTAAQFFYPVGIALDASGNLYVTDRSTVVRTISPTGVVSTVAGSASTGYADGPAIAAKLSLIQGIAVDGSGNIFVADRGANKIRKASIRPYGYTVGGHVVGLAGGSSLVLQNNGKDNLTVSANGLFTFATPLTDISGAASYNVSILTQPASQTCTIAHNTGGFTVGDVLSVSINCAAVSTFTGSGIAGYTDSTGTAAQFNFTADSLDVFTGMATDTSGNIYVADTANHVIRKITPAGVVSTIAPSAFNDPEGVAVDSLGNVYVGGDGAIKKISTGGVVTTLAGSGGQGYSDGTGTAAMFCGIKGIALDASSNVYVADSCNYMIRKVTQAGVVTTLAGIASPPLTGYVNGPGNIASFSKPTGIAVDSAGNIYVSDYDGYTIRKITPTGVVSTLAGFAELGGTYGYLNSTGTGAVFNKPSAVAVDASGNVYVTDTWNNVVRVINPMGTVLTLAGPEAPATTSGITNGNGAAALFNYPDGVAVDASGNVYVADKNNNVIRKIVQ